MKITAIVWTGEKSVRVRGRIVTVSRVNVPDGHQSFPIEHQTRTFEDTMLFHSRRPVRMMGHGSFNARWWMVNRLPPAGEPVRHPTGGYRTKKDVISSRQKGGR